MDRIHNILNNMVEAAQKTYDGTKRSDLKDSYFLFPETRSFPIVTPRDVPDAINNFGRMKGDMSYDAFLRKLYNKIKNKPDFVAALPEASKNKLGLNKKSSSQQKYESPFKKGDRVKNINQSCTHYGSEGIVDDVEPLDDDMGYVVKYRTINYGPTWNMGQTLKKTEVQLEKVNNEDPNNSPDLMDIQTKNMDLIGGGPETLMPTLLAPEAVPPQADDEMEVEEPSETEDELTEYKEDFYEMSLGSLRAISQHAQNILDHLELPHVKENLTESWLQGKIAITEDYMRTIHDFIMFVSEAADTILAADKPGLWENIRKKRERMGKKYKPAKPGDKDRPDPDAWKKAQK